MSVRVGRIASTSTLSFSSLYQRQDLDRRSVRDTNEAQGQSSGAILTFDTSTKPVIVARVAVSYTSQQNAKDNLERETTGWDFTLVRRRADALWNAQLSRIQIEGGTPAERRIVLHRFVSLFHPSQSAGGCKRRYLGMDDKLPSVRAWPSSVPEYSCLGPASVACSADGNPGSAGDQRCRSSR